MSDTFSSSRMLSVLLGGTRSNDSSSLSSPVMSLKDQFTTKAEILKFPIESSHSYSYAKLSPNSLALRLNVLRRSLEILKDRPSLINGLSHESPAQRSSISSNAPATPRASDKLPIPSNSSAAALAAFFRPSMTRSDSFPVDQIHATKVRKSPVTDQILEDDLKDIIELLDAHDMSVTENHEVASTLHDLSLSSNEPLRKTKQDAVKVKLLYALSTPFIDKSVMTTLDTGSSQYANTNASSVALNLLNNPQPAPTGAATNRPFHTMSAGKRSLPQSVFTIDVEAPWSVKAANDLACLMFGVAKSMIRSLTLMDLIAPQFREFVTDRIVKAIEGISTTQAALASSPNIIFSGEIVAIARPGVKDFAWTSLWAKRKNSLIIFMFDQIPCDAFNVVIAGDPSCSSFKVDSTQDVAGTLIADCNYQFHALNDISRSISEFMSGENFDNTMPYDKSYRLCESINQKRYFTLQLYRDHNVPCAVSSIPVEGDSENVELKLKIHSLPYIAGIFVLDASNFNIISCNNAIARNMFGWASVDLHSRSIDFLIDKFSDIFRVGMEDNESKFSLEPGLVLPEHFFRKYESYIKSESKNAESVEYDFIHSRGLIATHIDGRRFHVDVQLRVSDLDTYVLWITYSRSKGKFHKVLSNLEKVYQQTYADTNKHRKNKAMTTEERPPVSLPSQLKLFDSSNNLYPTTGEITRHNSTRKVNLSKVSVSLSLPKAPKLVEKRSVSTNTSRNSDFSYVSSGADSVDSKHTALSSFDMKPSTSQLYSDEDLLMEEDQIISTKMVQSTNWPKEIGLQRRTKKISEFNVVRDMGEGAYGKVILAQHKDDLPYEVIIKCIDKERILVDTWVRDRNLGTIPSEIQIMATLMKEKHANIMRIIDFFEDAQYYYLETPIFGNPPAIDLFDYIEIKKDMTERECALIFKQVVAAIYHLHKHGIVHRDIKDENVIVDERGVIKLIDFGSAGYTSAGPFDVFVGTIDYASPEVLRGEKYEGRAQDVWALGILLYTMLYKENPFYNVDEIMEGDLRIPYVLSEESTALIRKILIRDFNLRPSITDIYEDKWIQIY